MSENIYNKRWLKKILEKQQKRTIASGGEFNNTIKNMDQSSFDEYYDKIKNANAKTKMEPEEFIEVVQQKNSPEHFEKMKEMEIQRQEAEENENLQSYIVHMLKNNKLKKEYMLSNDKTPKSIKKSGSQILVRLNEDLPYKTIGVNKIGLFAQKGDYLNITDPLDIIPESVKLTRTFYEKCEPREPLITEVIDKMDINTNDYRLHTKKDALAYLEEHNNDTSKLDEKAGVAYDGEYSPEIIKTIKQLEDSKNKAELNLQEQERAAEESTNEPATEESEQNDEQNM